MTIDISDLERALGIALEQFKAMYGPAVTTDTDLYWSVLAPAKFNVYSEPKPSIGSLDDHVASVSRISRGEQECDPSVLGDIGEILKHLAQGTFPLNSSS